jgi:hypothetical protein
MHVSHTRASYLWVTHTLVYKMNNVDIFLIIELIRVVLDHIL